MRIVTEEVNDNFDEDKMAEIPEDGIWISLWFHHWSSTCFEYCYSYYLQLYAQNAIMIAKSK